MTAGAVLTGGASRRMGRTKALVEVGGVPMALRVMEALRNGGCDPIVLVGGDAGDLVPLGGEVVPDAWPGEGPLGGVLTALHTLDRGEAVVIAACDLPSLGAETVAALVDAPPADVVVAVGRRRHPTLARWSTAAVPSLQALFDDGERSLLGALVGLASTGHDVVELPVDEAELRNVNTPDDR